MEPSQNNNEPKEAESLETTPQAPAPPDASSELESADDKSLNQSEEVSIATPPDETAKSEEPAKTSLLRRIKARAKGFNIYMALFLLVVLASIAGILAIIWYNQQQESSQDPVSTQSLDEEALLDLRNRDVRIGDPSQVLSVESHAIFAGQVLVRDNLDVAGNLTVGGPLSLPGLSVAGTTELEQLQTNQLTVAGNSSIQGDLNIQNSLNVAGGASFGGPISAPQLNIESLELNQNLRINRHISTGGGTPSRTNGNALGGGGTSSVSGSDTAGTVTINTGSNPSAGCFITVRFVNAFASVPHVVITPVGSAAGSLNYYINRSANSFSVCSANAAPGGRSFSFDYIVIN